MRITDIRTVCVAVPLSTFGEFEPVTMWYNVRYASRKAIVFVDTDEDITGIGEAGDGNAQLIESVIKPRIVGMDPFDVEKCMATAVEHSYSLHGRHGRGSYGGVDMALWDIIGKACGKPVYKLLGGKFRDQVECRYWMCCKSPQDQAAEAKKAVERGWKALKVKIGTNPETDIERVKAIREAVGDGVEIGVDPNCAYNTFTAIRTIKKMERYDLSHVEQPVFDLDGMAEVRRHVDTPIVAHESCWSKEGVLEAIKKRAADGIWVSPSTYGGFLECKRACAVAAAEGLLVGTGSGASELGPANAALLHMITSTPNFWVPNDNSNHHLEPPSEDIIKKPFRTENGRLQAPDAPGLGIELDEAKLEQYHQIWLSGKYKHQKGLGRQGIYYWYKTDSSTWPLDLR